MKNRSVRRLKLVPGFRFWRDKSLCELVRFDRRRRVWECTDVVGGFPHRVAERSIRRFVISAKTREASLRSLAPANPVPVPVPAAGAMKANPPAPKPVDAAPVKPGTCFRVNDGTVMVARFRSSEDPEIWRCSSTNHLSPWRLTYSYSVEFIRRNRCEAPTAKPAPAPVPTPAAGTFKADPPANHATLRSINEDFNAVRSRLADTSAPLRPHDTDLLRIAVENLYFRLRALEFVLGTDRHE